MSKELICGYDLGLIIIVVVQFGLQSVISYIATSDQGGDYQYVDRKLLMKMTECLSTAYLPSIYVQVCS